MGPLSANNMAAPTRYVALPQFHLRVKAGLLENLNFTHETGRRWKSGGDEGWRWARGIREEEEEWVVRRGAMIGKWGAVGCGRRRRGGCFLYLLHQFQLNSTGAVVNKLEVQRKKPEEPRESEAGVHGRWHTLSQHIWPPTRPVCSITHSRFVTSHSAPVRKALLFLSLPCKWSH